MHEAPVCLTHTHATALVSDLLQLMLLCYPYGLLGAILRVLCKHQATKLGIVQAIRAQGEEHQ